MFSPLPGFAPSVNALESEKGEQDDPFFAPY